MWVKHIQKQTEKLVLSRMQSFLSAEKRRIVFKSFIESQFKYWVKKSNNKINRLHEKPFRIVYNDYESTYQELLSFIITLSINDQNMRGLAAEIYKVENDLSVGHFKNLFNFKDNYTLHIPSVNTELKGNNLMSILVW